MLRSGISGAIAGAILVLMVPLSAVAFDVPATADGARIQAPIPEAPLQALAPSHVPIHITNSPEAPAGAQELRFLLNDVQVEGAHALDADQLRALYAPLLGQTVALDIAWKLAAEITDQYKQAGYFLSRAYVPAQTVEGGILRITVVEGFVEQVTLGEGVADQPLVAAWSEKIKSYRPIMASQLEEAMLELNALPGMGLRAVLSPPENKEGDEGAVWLNLLRTPKPSAASVRMDNYGSRYLGPYQVGLAYELALLPGQRTSISALTSAPTDELQSLSVRHMIPVAPRFTLDVGGSYTTAAPGYLLRVQDIQSKTYSANVGLTYQWLRQRGETLSSRVGAEWRNTDADILDTPLTRDRLRMARLNVAYELLDRWQGYNTVSATVTQGIAGLGSNHGSDPYLSRAQAKPNFEKWEMNGGRIQELVAGVQAVFSVAGQVASGPLSSSEEFGYGGQSFGRAYDNSEITGDHGASASLEMRYTAIPPVAGVTPTPYAFYDAGVVWNDDDAQSARESASSVGFGLRARSDLGASTGIGIAFPLTHEVAGPIYSSNKRAPRFTAELSYQF